MQNDKCLVCYWFQLINVNIALSLLQNVGITTEISFKLNEGAVKNIFI